VLGALLCASAPAAALTPTAQDRHVFASHDIEPDDIFDSQETLSAPDYAPFSASTNGAAFPGIGVAGASQNSSIEPERLRVLGFTSASPGSRPDRVHEVASESVYSVDFTVDAHRSFTLTGGSVSVSASTTGRARPPSAASP
jgi:hypothetical protein